MGPKTITLIRFRRAPLRYPREHPDYSDFSKKIENETRQTKDRRENVALKRKNPAQGWAKIHM